MSVKRKVTVPVGRSLTTQAFRVFVTGANRNLDPAGTVDPVLDEYRPPLYEGGPGVKWVGPAIAQSGRSRRVRSASSAHLSIASSREDQAGWEARSGSAYP